MGEEYKFVCTNCGNSEQHVVESVESTWVCSECGEMMLNEGKIDNRVLLNE
jgi:ribosomal protein L37AE/L43A